MIYLLDSNVFITAHRMHYPLDIVISFWDKLEELAKAGQVISIDKVKNELFRAEDELKTWCTGNLPPTFFKDSQPCIGAYTRLVQWANSMDKQYMQRAITEFMEADNADAWLAAYALEKNCKIVTYEKSSPEIKRRIKIPEVCSTFSIPYTDPIGMLRELKVRI